MNSLKRLLVALAIALGSACQSVDKDALLVRADTRFEEGEFRAAIIDYSKFLERRPDSVRALNNRGVARLRTGDPQAAAADFDAAIALQPDFAEAFYNRG